MHVVNSDRALYGRLLGYLKPYWKAFTLAVLGMVGTAATEPAFPAIMKYLLDHGFQATEARMVWLIPTGIVALFVLRGVLSFLTSYLMTWVSTRLVTDLRRQMFSKILTLPTQTFHDQSSGKLISRILYDADNVNQAATTVLVTAVRESLTAVSLLGYLLYLDWKLTLITLAVGPVIAVIIKGFGKRIRSASKMSLNAMRKISHTIEESVATNKVIKIYGAQAQQIARFHSDTESFRRSMMREAVPASAMTPITHITAACAIALITYLALSQTTGQAGASAGGFVSFITAMLLLISPIKQLTTISPQMQRGLSASESVFELLDSDTEQDNGTIELYNVLGAIEFRDVCFRYPNTDNQALTHIDLNLPAGKITALVGSSGGGKTTIGALLPRFYHPTSGTICIDGINTLELTLQSLRRNIALVSQEVVLLNDTISANIAFGGSKPYSEQEIQKAAIAAHAWEFILQLSDGVQTLIGENGAKLSGGQRQRIAIARAILKNAPILILDEATSALDNESERQVQAALATLTKDRTTLIIAHRLSTIENADNIVVLDRGQIVEIGTHKSLMEKNGFYAGLNRLQK